jgi:transketolase
VETKKLIYNLQLLSKRMRKDILDMALVAGESASHLGSGLSIVEILAVLYGHIMNHQTIDPDCLFRDRFILSKGHGVLAYYAILAEMKYFSVEELLTFEKNESFLVGHPVRDKSKGIEFSTGSLGMGLGLGVGIAKALKMKEQSQRVFVLVGDGETNEGSIWEAAMFASHFCLNNLIMIVDKNGFQLGGMTKEIMVNVNLAQKLEAFGWNVKCVNGHDLTELLSAFKSDPFYIDRPTAIVAETVKGKGISFIEANNNWHHASLSKQQYEKAIKELQ